MERPFHFFFFRNVPIGLCVCAIIDTVAKFNSEAEHVTGDEIRVQKGAKDENTNYDVILIDQSFLPCCSDFIKHHHYVQSYH